MKKKVLTMLFVLPLCRKIFNLYIADAAASGLFVQGQLLSNSAQRHWRHIQE